MRMESQISILQLRPHQCPFLTTSFGIQGKLFIQKQIKSFVILHHLSSTFSVLSTRQLQKERSVFYSLI